MGALLKYHCRWMGELPETPATRVMLASTKLVPWASRPLNVGAAPVDGWYHLQFEAVPGDADQTTFRTWANNNDQAMPSSEHVNMPEALGVTGWDGTVDVVGYWGVADMPDIGFIIDDFEIGPVFDPNWAQ